MAKRKRRQKNYDRYVDILRTGHDFFNEFVVFPSMEELRQVWLIIGKDILAKWIEEKAGTRPYGYWAFSCDSLKKCFIHKQCNCIRNTHDNWHARLFPEQFETDRQFLERLDLLTDSERADLFLRDSKEQAAKMLKETNNLQKDDYEED